MDLEALDEPGMGNDDALKGFCQEVMPARMKRNALTTVEQSMCDGYVPCPH